MPFLTPAERKREDAIVAVGGALLTVSREHRPSVAECRDMAVKIVDVVTAHTVDVVRTLIEAERELHPLRCFEVQPDGSLKETTHT